MNAIGASILVVLVLAVLFSPRRWALLAMMAGVLYLTQAQQIIVLGFNFYAMRFLELAGFVRVMARREFSFRQLNGIDNALILLYAFSTVVFLIRSPDGKANAIGGALDAFLCYFTFRGLMDGVESFRWFLRAFFILLAPYTLLILIESVTGHNHFAVLGGVTGGSAWMRHGLPRCFGSFREPDTLGMFAASFIPLYIGLACIANKRKLAVFCLCLCLLLVWAANSGGAASGAAVGLVCWGLWRFRTVMWKVRRLIVAMIVLLTIGMKAPIWYLFARASAITGGDGWHRSYLIQMFYEHFGQWWLAGMSPKDTSGWMGYDLATVGGADITNQYLGFGINAGLGAVVLFVLLLKRAYGGLGKVLAAVRSSSSGTSEAEFLLWGLGVMLVVHIVNWFGIAYFDQIYVIWFMQLAAIATLSQAYLARPEAAVVEEAVIEPEMEEPQPTAVLGQIKCAQYPSIVAADVVLISKQKAEICNREMILNCSSALISDDGNDL